VKGIKGRSSRVLRQQFRVLRTRIPTLWTNSYIVSSVGGAPLALIKQYYPDSKEIRKLRLDADSEMDSCFEHDPRRLS
jgi:putative transposase